LSFWHRVVVDDLTRLVLDVFRVNGALLAMGDDLVAPFGLTSARWQVLGAVALTDERLTVPGVARAMGLSRQAVQRQVTLLVDEGLLTTEPNPGHQRSPQLALTPRGRAAFHKAQDAWSKRARELAGGWSRNRVRQACEVLERLTQQLETGS
jgi:DNA-binding MarR family transcriptional regulator